MRWYVKTNGETSGPVDDHTVAAWLREGRLNAAATMVAAEGANDWTPIGQSPFATGAGQPPTPTRGKSGASKILLAFGAFAIFGFGTCAIFVAVAAKRTVDAEVQRTNPTTNPTADDNAAEVAIGTLLSEYKDNEVRADQKFKGQLISTTGTVGEVKKDVLDHIYVTVGTGALFEIPTVQCFPVDGQESNAATLSKGDTVKIQGRVEGLMMNVLIKECRLVARRGSQ